MMVDTDKAYRAALERHAALGDPREGSAESVEFLEWTAAMLDFEARNHPAVGSRKE
jgi:hypothetical protein